MNAILKEEQSFRIDPAIDRQKLAEQFRARRRVHVSNFLPHAVADALSRHLVREMAYQTYVVADEEELATSPGADSELTAEDEREMLEAACNGARTGFASYYDANRSLTGEPDSREGAGWTAYDTCIEFLNSPGFLDFARQVSGIGTISRADAHATRFGPGQFVLFSNGTFSADATGKRRVNFELNLTHQWRPEWGGMLEMRGQEGHEIEAVMPCFNCLELFSFPRGYWISQVAPFAHASRYAIAGSLYID